MVPIPKSAASDRFRLGEAVGQWPAGTVFEGYDLRLDRPVAVCEIHPQTGSSPSGMVKLIGAARAAAQLRSPNIAASFAEFQQGDRTYLLSELVKGEPLDRLLRNNQPLDDAKTLQILREVASALSHAHARGTPHCDLHPGNILLDEDGVIKVKDFLTAAAAKELLSGLERKQAWDTAGYRAPELDEGRKPGPASDVFSLGVLAYRLLCRTLPFPGPDFSAQKKAPLLEPDGSGPPEAAMNALRKALDPVPGRRFGSAVELYAALKAAL